MTSWARPGVKCVCVDAIQGLIKGETYTIEQVLPLDDSGYLGVLLRECRSAITWTNTVGGFRLSRFRPLIARSQEDDVALFRKLLVTEGADA